jgi:hypothetical protein
MIVGLAVAVWFYSERVAEKERLWKKVSGDQYSTLDECIDYAHGVPGLMAICMQMEERVDKGAGG